MKVNLKKPLRLKNPTKYFIPDKDRIFNTVCSPSSYTARMQKIEGIESRLYWQYYYCSEHNGQTFYYTLTYNDAKVPKYFGINCFDYEDLRDLLTGGFRKRLLRKYSTVFKYFIGAELGDGKGKRGLHNNPHYHILFFLEPSPEPVYRIIRETVQIGVYKRNGKIHKKGEARYVTLKRRELVPYTKISPSDFRHFVKLYWQGFDENTDGFQDYRTSLYGIAKEGKNCGLVTDYRACIYCAKYVCKDAKLKMHEEKVFKQLNIRERKKHDDEFQCYFLHNFLFERYNVPLNASKTTWQMNEIELIESILPGYYDFYRHRNESFDFTLGLKETIKRICDKEHLWSQYFTLFSQFVDDFVQTGLNEYRNRFCNKCRISQGVGDYALEFITDKLNPSIQVPSKDGFKERNCCLYYYRKLYTNVVRPIESGFCFGKPSSFSSIRILNSDGVAYKLSQLPKQLKRVSENARILFELVRNDKELYYDMYSSDVNTEVTLSYEQMFHLIDKLPFSPFDRYAEFRLIYKDRFFKIPSSSEVDIDSNHFACCFPVIDIYRDYERFLHPSLCSVSRSDLRLETFLDSGCEGYLPYSQHPYFLQFLSVFNLLDLCTDYFFVQNDNQKQKEAERLAEVKRFHSKKVMQDFFKPFTNV